MFRLGKKKRGKRIEIDGKELQEQLVKEERQFMEGEIPTEREQVTELIRRLSNELMEYKQRVTVLQEELKGAVKRKKVPRDYALGKYAIVLFSLPEGEEKVRMHTVDNVHGNQVTKTIKDLMRDKDNEFVGAYVLMEMRGRKDGYERLRRNAEGCWHLFQCLDGDLKTYDPERKREDDEEEVANPYQES